MKRNFPNFLSFLLNENIVEANAHGSVFEQKIADNIQLWLKHNNLNNRFSAERYQTLTEFDGNRDEDYSDIVIYDKKSKNKIFVECKQSVADNISQLMIDLVQKNDTVIPIPVKGINREPVEGDVYKALSKVIRKNDEFKAFISFLNTPIKFNKKTYLPRDFYFDNIECDNNTLVKLIHQYNNMIDSLDLTAQNQHFDPDVIRSTTINMLACALLWRLSDKTRTWDICHVPLHGIGFSKMIVTHYQTSKAEPVDYIQIGTNTLFRFTENNPLNIECDIFPEKLQGQFDLKFTPRLGTGSVYITSRSKIAETLSSSTSFGNEKKWPKYLG